MVLGMIAVSWLSKSDERTGLEHVCMWVHSENKLMAREHLAGYRVFPSWLFPFIAHFVGKSLNKVSFLIADPNAELSKRQSFPKSGVEDRSSSTHVCVCGPPTA